MGRDGLEQKSKKNVLDFLEIFSLLHPIYRHTGVCLYPVYRYTGVCLYPVYRYTGVGLYSV